MRFYSDIEDEQEAVNMKACLGTAFDNGFSQHQSESCEDGEMNCINCPFSSPFDLGDTDNHWTQFTRKTNAPKLFWLMVKLRELKIPHRIHGMSFHAPILEVRKGDFDRAAGLLSSVDNISDYDEMFKNANPFIRGELNT